MIIAEKVVLGAMGLGVWGEDGKREQPVRRPGVGKCFRGGHKTWNQPSTVADWGSCLSVG